MAHDKMIEVSDQQCAPLPCQVHAYGKKTEHGHSPQVFLNHQQALPLIVFVLGPKVGRGRRRESVARVSEISPSQPHGIDIHIQVGQQKHQLHEGPRGLHHPQDPWAVHVRVVVTERVGVRETVGGDRAEQSVQHKRGGRRGGRVACVFLPCDPFEGRRGRHPERLDPGHPLPHPGRLGPESRESGSFAFDQGKIRAVLGTFPKAGLVFLFPGRRPIEILPHQQGSLALPTEGSGRVLRSPLGRHIQGHQNQQQFEAHLGSRFVLGRRGGGLRGGWETQPISVFPRFFPLGGKKSGGRTTGQRRRGRGRRGNPKGRRTGR
mmetsp:Transcript_40478/g.104919  ORF Transcript_40478/g.104919 Transcript_40478/m.104919 type:complete len:320 (-) Transcript_40478:538-1497(-)